MSRKFNKLKRVKVGFAVINFTKNDIIIKTKQKTMKVKPYAIGVTQVSDSRAMFQCIYHERGDEMNYFVFITMKDAKKILKCVNSIYPPEFYVKRETPSYLVL